MQTQLRYQVDVGADESKPPGGVRGLCTVVGLCGFQACAFRFSPAFRRELACAEAEGEISDFIALSLMAVLAISEHSEFASDYLEMAKAVASSPGELAAITEARRAYDWLVANPCAAAECLAAAIGPAAVVVDDGPSTDLWTGLMATLRRLGETETETPEQRRDPRAA
jgi:hypothetical protein